jgi:hypothetical protein
MKVAFAAILLCLTAFPVQAQLNPRERCLAEASAKGLWVPPQDGRFRPTAKANYALRPQRRTFMRSCMRRGESTGTDRSGRPRDQSKRGARYEGLDWTRVGGRSDRT